MITRIIDLMWLARCAAVIHSQILDQAGAFLDQRVLIRSGKCGSIPFECASSPFAPSVTSVLSESCTGKKHLGLCGNRHSSLRLARALLSFQANAACTTTIVIYTWRSAATFFFACSVYVSARRLI